jgi:hypothetical protein
MPALPAVFMVVPAELFRTWRISSVSDVGTPFERAPGLHPPRSALGDCSPRAGTN